MNGKTRTFTTAEGEEVTIRERKAFDISPHTELEVLSCE